MYWSLLVLDIKCLQESNHWKEKPVTMLDTHNLVLYVSQRELAVVDPESLGMFTVPTSTLLGVYKACYGLTV